MISILTLFQFRTLSQGDFNGGQYILQMGNASVSYFLNSDLRFGLNFLINFEFPMNRTQRSESIENLGLKVL